MAKIDDIARARAFLSALSEGKDPLNGGDIENGDIVKNPLVSKRFKYVSGILERCLDDGIVRDNFIAIYKTPDCENDERTIENAKSFIQSLLNNTDPVSGEEFKGSILQNEEHSRSLSYTLEQLETLKIIKRPFEISEEQLENFEYSDEPLQVTEIIERLSRLTDSEYMASMKGTLIGKFLECVHIMETHTTPQGSFDMPTSVGKEFGVTVQYKADKAVLLFNRAMQEFIVMNIPKILNLSDDICEKMNSENADSIE